MNLRSLAAAATAAALLTGLAGPSAAQTKAPAQQPSTTSAAADGLAVKALRELDDNDRTAHWNGRAVDELEDMDIVNAEGEKIGEVEEVLADAAGNVVALTAEAGGFLGLGDKEVVVSTEHLRLEGERLTTSLTAEQLETMPRWDDD